MAGWTNPDRELTIWDGTIQADGFKGDGSRITNLPAGSEVDPVFTAASAAIWDSIDSSSFAILQNITDISVVSGALYLGTSSAITTHVALTNEHIDWTAATQDLDTSGDVSGALIYGDGSNLTNLPAGSEVDPTFQAASGAYNSHLANNTIHFTSGAIWSDINDNTSELTGTSSAVTAHVALVDEHLNWKNSVGTIHADNYTNTTYTGGNDITLDGTAFDLNTGVSGAISQNVIDIGVVSGALYDGTSGAIAANTAELLGTSSAITAHVADSSDPHGSILTQTILSLTSGAVTGDMSTSGAVYIPNVLFNTTSAGITAGNYPMGSVLLVYEA